MPNTEGGKKKIKKRRDKRVNLKFEEFSFSNVGTIETRLLVDKIDILKTIIQENRTLRHFKNFYNRFLLTQNVLWQIALSNNNNKKKI